MMSEATFDEIAVLSSIYCREGEFQLVQESVQDGFIIQINSTVGGEGGPDVSLLFHLDPRYPTYPPDISISSTRLSRTQCQNIRQQLLKHAATLDPEPMVHQLVDRLQSVEVIEDHKGGEQQLKETEKEEEWTAVLLLDHIRSRARYIGLLERWSQQLQLSGTLLLGQIILVILQGDRNNIKEFRHLLKTVKVDVDSTGKKCKERMMKVLIETLSSSGCEHSLQGFVVRSYQTLPELTTVFQELNMTKIYQQIQPSLSD